MKALNIEQIQEIIPHRHPFLLVDAIEDFEPGEFAVGYKCVTYREEFFPVSHTLISHRKFSGFKIFNRIHK